MAMRNIISIDESKCNGCGACVTGCAEGALAIVDGKAKLVKESYCDGLGACIGKCPTGALKIEKRASDEFDAAAVAQHQQGTAPKPAAAPHPAHFPGHVCPSTRMMRAPAAGQAVAAAPLESGGGGMALRSELQQWPVQLHLVSTDAPFFKGRELVVLSTCAPVASADVHWRWLRGRSVVVGCPKLDDTANYVEKLAAILSDPTIPAAVVVRMEVPCCGGLTAILKDAAAKCGRAVPVYEAVIALDGALGAPRRI